MRVWDQLLNAEDCPYEFSVENKPGTRFPAKPPYPDLEVLSVTDLPVERLVNQVLRVRASMPEEGAQAEYVVSRMVAVLSGGGEIELQRIAVPAESAESNVDIARCAACGGTVPHGECVECVDPEDNVVKGYHRRCVDDG